jgi:hypothetical protein
MIAPPAQLPACSSLLKQSHIESTSSFKELNR